MPKPKVQIIVDTREQKPLEFLSNDVEVVRETIDVGDYAIRVDGQIAPIRIERKSRSDLFSSFVGDSYRREKSKIMRAKELQCEYVIAIEKSIGVIRRGHEYMKNGQLHRVKKDGLSQIRQMMEIERKYNTRVYYLYGRDEMTLFVQEKLLTYARHDDWRGTLRECGAPTPPQRATGNV